MLVFHQLFQPAEETFLTIISKPEQNILKKLCYRLFANDKW